MRKSSAHCNLSFAEETVFNEACLRLAPTGCLRSVALGQSPHRLAFQVRKESPVSSCSYAAAGCKFSPQLQVTATQRSRWTGR